MEFVKLPLWFGKTHSEGIVTFDIGVQCVQCSAKRLVPHLAAFFPSTVGRSLEFLAAKKFGKELGVNGPRGELNFIFHSPKSQLNVCIYSFVYSQTRRMFALKGSFGFDLIIPMDSLTFIPFSCCEKNLRRI